MLAAAACTLPLSVVACGGGDDGGGDDGGSDNGTPTGDHHQYVVKKATVTSANTDDLSLDFGSKTSSTPDGRVDNRIGQALGLLSSFFDIQGTVDKAIAQGTLILLVDVQTTDFTNNTAGAGLSVKFGATPNPPACSSATDTTCGGHLQGGATFTIAAGSPTNAQLSGKVINGTFNAGPGNVALQIAIGDSPIKLSLTHARAQATGMSASGVTSLKVGGVLTQTDLNTQVGPAIKTAVDAIINTDCPAPRTAPGCNCAANSTGAKVITMLDGDLTPTDKDCTVSLDEILKFPAVAAVLQPDSCSMDTCTTPDALSIGVQVVTTSASFPTGGD
ncbi:MAG TPA: hypothetical protein VGC42_14925 [Kofleriaceae bacterium]